MTVLFRFWFWYWYWFWFWFWFRSASLAVSDTGFLLFLMCGKSYALLSLLDPVAGNYWLQRHNGPVLGNYLGFLSISNVITALIAVERCRCVLAPLKAATFFRTRSMGLVMGAVSLSVLVVENVVMGFKYQTVPLTHPLTNTSTFISRLSPTYLRHRTLLDVLEIYLVSVTLPLLSLLVVVLCTAAIIVRLRVSATWRRGAVLSGSSMMTSVERQEATMTRMLVTVCGVYVLCMTPSVCRALLLFSRVPGFLITGHLCNIFKVSTSFTLILEALNASVNFLIYVKQSSHYRCTLRRLLWLHCLHVKEGGGW
ncbi:uncharacterized protein LOC143291021 [Babylonia areolata]|uniref:uncharacterized protein LOC143291021 n=1 Tax=Babylonia areolata TaxID=304850 RepID=UPI003FD56CB1